MKLSHAIREGAKIRPQCYHALFNNGCSCALGAAAEYLGLPYTEYILLKDVAEFLEHRLGYNPNYEILPTDMRSVSAYVTILNDEVDLTREQIADKLEEYYL